MLSYRSGAKLPPVIWRRARDLSRLFDLPLKDFLLHRLCVQHPPLLYARERTTFVRAHSDLYSNNFISVIHRQPRTFTMAGRRNGNAARIRGP